MHHAFINNFLAVFKYFSLPAFIIHFNRFMVFLETRKANVCVVYAYKEFTSRQIYIKYFYRFRYANLIYLNLYYMYNYRISSLRILLQKEKTKCIIKRNTQVNRVAHYRGNRFFWTGVASPGRSHRSQTLFVSQRSRHCVSPGYQTHEIIRCPGTMESRTTAGKSSAILQRISCFRDAGSLMLIN